MQSTARAYLLTSGLVFGLVALLHLTRAVNDWALVLGPIPIPVVASWVAFVATGALCVWAFRLARA